MHCDVGLSLQPLNLFKTMFAKFLVAPPLAGFAIMVGANDKRLSHDSLLLGSATMLTRMFNKAMAHIARAAYYYYYYLLLFFLFFFYFLINIIKIEQKSIAHENRRRVNVRKTIKVYCS